LENIQKKEFLQIHTHTHKKLISQKEKAEDNLSSLIAKAEFGRTKFSHLWSAQALLLNCSSAPQILSLINVCERRIRWESYRFRIYHKSIDPTSITSLLRLKFRSTSSAAWRYSYKWFIFSIKKTITFIMACLFFCFTWCNGSTGF